MSILIKPFTACFALTLVFFVTACGSKNNDLGPDQSQEPPPAAVNVAPVVKRTVNDWDQFNGRIEAIERVEVRPRVSGYLASVDFREGSLVKKGDLLFTIDNREFQASLNRAMANKSSAKNRKKLAVQELKRSENLIAVQAISAEEFDQRKSEAFQADAQIALAEAELVQAQLNVEFATIRAAIDGRVGEARVKPGNLVAAGTTLLTTLVSIDPVYVVFEGDESVYLKYQSQARSGDRPSSRNAANPVQVGLINEEGFPHLGEMDFVDNELDPSTGTIRGRAVLDNADGRFTPGLFARVRLLGSGEREVLLIADRAVLTDQDRQFVYTVGANSEAVRQDVVLGRQVDGLRIVQSGLVEGQKVVVNGVSKIFFPGAPLETSIVTMDDPQGKLISSSEKSSGVIFKTSPNAQLADELTLGQAAAKH